MCSSAGVRFLHAYFKTELKDKKKKENYVNRFTHSDTFSDVEDFSLLFKKVLSGISIKYFYIY